MGRQGWKVAGVLAALLGAATVTSCASVVDTPRAGSSEAPALQMVSPDFTLETAAGEPVTLSKRVMEGPVVLVFYRGHW